MQNYSGRLLTVLLLAVLLLQFWTLRRQGELEQQIRSIASQQSELQHRVGNELSGLQGSLREMAEAERWVAVLRESVEPAGNCEAATARIEWELRQWMPGTASRLLFRTESGATWREAEVQSLGGQSYAATFLVPGQPVLEAGVAVQHERGQGGRSSVAVEATARDKSAFDRNYQYQIVAEGPGGSRSSGVRSIPLGGQFVVPAKIDVKVRDPGQYQVRLFTDRMEQNPCARLESAEARGYIGDQRTVSMPLTEQDRHLLAATWQSDTPLTRLEIAIRHSGGEEVVPVHLPAR